MRALLILLFLGCAFQTLAQHKLTTISYVDGVPLNKDLTGAFAASETKSHRLTIGSIRDTVFIALKNHELLHKLLTKNKVSFYQLAVLNIAGFTRNSQVIFFRNDTLILDTVGVRMARLSVFQPTVLRAIKTSYYQNFTDVTFFYIYTKPQPFYIR